MRVQVLTLRYDAARGGFDDGPLVALAERRQVLSVSEHFFRVQEIPHLACVVRWQEGSEQPSSAPVLAPLTNEADNAAANGARPRARRARTAPPVEVPEAARPAFERLRAWRRERARREGLPAFALLTDRQLAALAASPAGEVGSRAAIEALGPGKVRWLGEELAPLLQADAALSTASGG
jgi:superfamily II DNA helicase RecQ